MKVSHLLMLALAGSALPLTPTQAQLLGGGVTGAINGAVGGTLQNGSLIGNATGSLRNISSGNLRVERSLDAGSGHATANAGLTGSVSSIVNVATSSGGLGQSIGLAGSSSTDASASGNAGLTAQAIGTDQIASTVAAAQGQASAAVSAAGSGAANVAGQLSNATPGLAGMANASLASSVMAAGSAAGSAESSTEESASQPAGNADEPRKAAQQPRQ